MCNFFMCSLRLSLLLVISVSVFGNLSAQEAVIKEYISVVGDYSSIFNGQIKADYSSLQYENNPYYNSNEFVAGELILKNNLRYPNQRLRIDLYAEQLEILTPHSHYGIIADTRHLDRAILGKETFVLLNPAPKAGISAGFYELLSENSNLKLYKKERKKIFSQGLLIQFYSDIKYYVDYDGKYTQVKNKNSFNKLFPQHKQQINKFCKEMNLNFNTDNRKNALTLLADYCSKLISTEDAK